MNTVGVVAFAFGAPETIRSNRLIAQIASKKARELNAPIYTQLDICVDLGIEVEYTDEKSGNPPPTLRIARGAVQWAQQHEITELWVVAAKPHLWRALRDIQYAVREAGARIEVLVCKEVEQYPEDFWFCSDSTMKRSRSREWFDAREEILKLIPFWLYRWVAR